MNENNIIHREKTGLREYSITSENQEVVDGWRAKVEEILAVIEENNPERLLEVMKNGKYIPELAQKAMEKFADASEEKKKFLAIAFWILRDQAQWSGFVKTAIPFLKGGQKELAQLMEKGEVPTCLDSSVLVMTVAGQLGLHGSIKKTGNRFSHRYFESVPADQNEAPTLVDVWWAYKEGGIIDDEAQLEDLKQKNEGMSHMCGQMVHETKKKIGIS